MAAAVPIAGTAGLAVLLLAMWLEHRTELTLPAPTGPFGVTRVIETWTDQSRPDALAELTSARTALVVWAWLPTSEAAGAVADYVPARLREELVKRQGALLSGFLMRDLSRVRAHSRESAAPSVRVARPVIILRAGLGALTAQYTTLAEDLASHGYVVVGFDAPYRTGVVVLPDGGVVIRPSHLNPETLAGPAADQLLEKLTLAWASDIGFVIDRLTAANAASSGPFAGQLDLARIGVIGHSLGGASAAQFCHDDSRCRAGVDMDGALHGTVVRDGLRQPFMFVSSDHGNRNDSADRRISGEIQSVFERLPAETRAAIVIEGADHFSFTDQLLTRSRLIRTVMGVRLEPRRGLEITANLLRSFLDLHLNGAPQRTFTEMTARYPEIRADFGKQWR